MHTSFFQIQRVYFHCLNWISDYGIFVILKATTRGKESSGPRTGGSLKAVSRNG